MRCIECEKDYWPQQSWMHEFKDGLFRCTGKPARNAVAPQAKALLDLPSGKRPTESAVATAPFDRKTYQREYMRVWRKRRARQSRF